MRQLAGLRWAKKLSKIGISGGLGHYHPFSSTEGRRPKAGCRRSLRKPKACSFAKQSFACACASCIASRCKAASQPFSHARMQYNSFAVVLLWAHGAATVLCTVASAQQKLPLRSNGCKAPPCATRSVACPKDSEAVIGAGAKAFRAFAPEGRSIAQQCLLLRSKSCILLAKCYNLLRKLAGRSPASRCTTRYARVVAGRSPACSPKVRTKVVEGWRAGNNPFRGCSPPLINIARRAKTRRSEATEHYNDALCGVKGVPTPFLALFCLQK